MLFIVLASIFLAIHVFGFQVERNKGDGDSVFSITDKQCTELAIDASYSNGKCQCNIGETIYNINNESPKCFKGTGKNLKCEIADMNYPTSIKTYDRNEKYTSIIADFGKIFSKCSTSNHYFELWDRYQGWKKVNYFAIKRIPPTSFKIGWGDYDDYDKYHAGRLFKLTLLNCPKAKPKNCFLFKALGKETNPSTTTVATKTIASTTNKSTMLTSTILTTSSSTHVARVSNKDKNSSTSFVGPIIGVTFFIIVVIVGVIGFCIWFKKRHEEETMAEWFKEKIFSSNEKNSKNQLSQKAQNSYYNSSDTHLPVIPNFPKRPSPASYRENKGLVYDDVYLTPVPTPKSMKGAKNQPNDFYDMVADDENIDTVQNEDFYDAVADNETPAYNNDIYDMVADDETSNDQFYDIVEENNAASRNKNKSIPKITIQSASSIPYYNEELPPSPLIKDGLQSYSCLDDVNDTKQQYCTLNSKNQENGKPNHKLNSNDVSPSSSIGSQGHLYFETEIGS